jgi:hypothetical protein
MTATLIINKDGMIDLPEEVRLVFGAKAGLKIRAEVSADRIELVKEIPATARTMRSPSGRLVLAPTSVTMDSASALRGERNGLASRGLRK